PTIAPGAPVGPIRIPTEDMPPAASTAGSLTGNLKSDDTTIITDSFDYSDPKTYNYQSQVEATDTLGQKHTVRVYLVHTAGGEWKAYARDETARGTPDVTSLDLRFDSNGNMDTAAMASTKMTINGAAFNGSAPLSIDMDLSSLTRRATDSLVKVDTIDGQAPGKYQSFVIGDSGEVVATYSNGQRQTVAQIVLADFAKIGRAHV